MYDGVVGRADYDENGTEPVATFESDPTPRVRVSSGPLKVRTRVPSTIDGRCAVLLEVTQTSRTPADKPSDAGLQR